MVAQITAGSVIPAQPIKETAPDAATPLELKGKNIIVGVPGAFTGTCHAQVPGYIEAYDKFKAKGVNEIYVVSVNDVFVTKAWKENLAPNGSDVHFIADDTAAFTKSVGLDFDATPVLGGPRSKRYVIVTEDDKVVAAIVEPDPSKATVTTAEKVLENL
ncbi:hypothetical protein H0H81_011436 [Sphagnurus paluster]|uniref:Thioredoxin domain-containing protein n=1 Tax=Sphagnurus paluster TaxID=117069 RepID=A0A9P7KKZ5_9AGAR|nr:hypothetical protein H0H81_011436 [Sphagnurus paluster]